MNMDAKVSVPAATEQYLSGYFLPWEKDAIGTLAQASVAQLRHFRMVRPSGLDAFLENTESPVLVLVGSRGTGKTIALTVKAAKMFALNSGGKYHTLRPYSPWINRLLPGEVVIGPERYSMYAHHATWVSIWKLVLGTHFAILILRNEFSRDIPQDGEERIAAIVTRLFRCPKMEKLGAYEFLEKVVRYAVGHTESIARAIAFLLEHKINSVLCRGWLEQYVDPILAKASGEREYTIFIDGVDECLGSGDMRLFDLYGKNGGDESSTVDRENERAAAHELWLHVQTGFIDAVYHLRESTSAGCRAYGTVRSEVFARYLDKTVLNLAKVEGSLILSLNYSSDDLERVFDLHVEWTPIAELMPVEAGGTGGADHRSSCERLFGTDMIAHPRVFGSDERALRALIRHSFGAPRELVMLAAAAKNSVPPVERKQRVEDMIDAVNAAAIDVFNDYVPAVFPIWDKRYEAGFVHIVRNVLPAEQVRVIEETFAERFGAQPQPPLFDFLYARGLIGIPSGAAKSRIEFFRPNGTEKPLLEGYKYLVLHPALSARVCSELPPGQQLEFYSSRIIVGQGLEAPPELVTEKLLLRRATSHKGLDVLINGNVIAEPDSKHRCGQVLLYGLVCAIRRHKQKMVSAVEICAEIKALCGEGLYPPNWRKGQSTVEFVAKGLQSKGADREPHILKRCKGWVRFHELHIRFHEGAPSRFGLAWGPGDVHQQWVDLTPSDIEIRI